MPMKNTIDGQGRREIAAGPISRYLCGQLPLQIVLMERLDPTNKEVREYVVATKVYQMDDDDKLNGKHSYEHGNYYPVTPVSYLIKKPEKPLEPVQLQRNAWREAYQRFCDRCIKHSNDIGSYPATEEEFKNAGSSFGR